MKNNFLVFLCVMTFAISGLALAAGSKEAGKLFVSECSTCHSYTLVKYHKGYSVDLWEAVIDRMKLAPVSSSQAVLVITDEDREAVAGYLSSTYK